MDIYTDKNAPSISEVFFTDLGWVGVIGSSKTIEATITSVQEFQSPVIITSSGAVEGITVQITPSSVVPQPNTPATANVIISVASSVTPDTYTITILAQSGILSKTQVVTIDVPLSDFTIDILSLIHI